MLLALGLLSIAVWLALLLAWHGFWRADVRLPLNPGELAHWPPVVAVVPARNEEATIPYSLTSLLDQRYPGHFQIVLADDSSTDETANMAVRLGSDSERRLSVIEAGPLPDGWLGKTWALSRGVEEARQTEPAYYWLTDADIAHRPQTLANMVSHAEANRLALASGMVKLPVQNAWEKLLVPAFIFYFALLYPFRGVNDPSSPIAGAAGGSLLIRRDALEAVGGIAAIKDAVIDDCALARAVKRSGRLIWLGLAERSRSLRRHERLSEFRAMVARSAYPQLGYSPILLVMALVGMAVTFLAPPLLLLADDATFWAGALAWGLMAGAYWPTVRYNGLSPLWALTLPLAALLFSAMAVESAVAHHQRRPPSWRGRGVGIADTERP